MELKHSNHTFLFTLTIILFIKEINFTYKLGNDACAWREKIHWAELCLLNSHVEVLIPFQGVNVLGDKTFKKGN